MSVNKVYTNIDKVLGENYQTSLPLSASLLIFPFLEALEEMVPTVRCVSAAVFISSYT